MNNFLILFKKILVNKKLIKNINRGFSLFELLIYLAIFSALIVISTNMFVSLSRGHGQSSAKSEVNSAVRFVTEILRQDIKNSSGIITPSAVGISSQTLSLTRQGQLIIYDVEGGILRRKEGDNLPVNLVDLNISIENPIFTRVENKNLILNSTNIGIKTEMVFKYNSTSPDWNYSATLKNTVNLIDDGAKTFVGAPVLENNLIAETGTKSVSDDWSSYDNVYINDGVIVTFEAGTHNLGSVNLIINSGGKITALPSTQTGYGGFGVTITTTGIITIASGGHIDANAKGYIGSPNKDTILGYGPRGGAYAYWGGGGASHGGLGGMNSIGNPQPTVYGDANSPITLGSGGGSNIGYCGAGSNGGVGGGAIKIIANTLINNGIISADAENREKMPGGGSGGSIWIDVINLTGSNGGIFSANGGSAIYMPSADERCTGSGGGGGRISLNSSGVDTYGGSITVSGGDGMQGGEAGTIVRNVTNPGDVIIASGTVIWTTGVHKFKNLTVNVDATLTTGAAQGRTRGSGNVFVTGSGLGGGRSTNFFGASGAGHASTGGVAQYTGSLAGGVSYNTDGLQVFEPTDLGSGGGGGAVSGSLGGYGGGAIKIITTENLINNGNINSDGGDANIAGNYAGGGSGGSLWISVGGTLSSTNGVFSARGGAASLNNGQNRGGGSGGRISFSYGSANLSGHTVIVAGGLGTPTTNSLFAGGNGTINGL